MDLFELVASLGIDTGGFTGGLRSALNTALGWLEDFAKDVLDTGMGFDKEMSAVQAVLGKTEGTIENMNELRAFALDQARDSIFTAEQTAQAYYYMGMAGWKTEEMLSGLPGIMALAAASGEDLGMVSDIVTDSLTAFGWSADRAGEFADILAQAATNSNTDVKRMGETFKYIAPIAGSLGVEVEDVALSIGLLASQGIKGSMAGTALRNILVRLSTNAGETKKDLGALTILTEKLGVQFWDSSGKMRDFSDIIREARVSWQGLTQEEQTYYAKQIGSQRGMAAWMALMNAAEEDVDQLAYAFANAEGAAQGMADVKLDNLWGDIQMFNSSLDVLKVAIYDDVKGPLREVVQYATGALDRIRDAIVGGGGLTAGIHQLAIEITDFGKKYQDEIAELARSFVPILATVIGELAPAFADAAINLGGALIEGVIKGLGDQSILGLLTGKNTTAGPIADFLGKLIVGRVDTVISSFDPLGIDAQANVGKIELPENWRELQAEWEASNPIDATVTPNIEEDTFVDKFREFLETDFLNNTIGFGWVEKLARMLNEGTTETVDAVSSASLDAANTYLDSLSEASGKASSGIVDDLSDAGTNGGKDLAANVGTELSYAEPGMRDGLTNVLSEAGDPIGTNIANSIYNKLISTPYQINVTANVSGLPGVNRNASAMAGGRIYRHPSIFGYYDGAYQMAGDAGPEAVIGVNSLGAMIANAVNRGMAGQEIVVPRSNPSPRNIVIPVYIDGRELARAEVPYIEAEQQRVGTRLVTGVRI